MKEFYKKREKEIKGMIVGLVIGMLFMLLLYPERIAELANGEEVAAIVSGENVTADTIYKGFKDKYGVSELVEVVDNIILEPKYSLTDSDLEKIKSIAENYYSQYETYYQISKEEFLSQNNFESEEDFIEYLKLDYRRELFVNDYLSNNVTDSEVEEYYNTNYFTPFKVEHILVKTSEDVTTDDAKALIEEIIDKLDSGTSWDTIKSKYKSKITTEDLTVEFDSNYEDSFMSASKKLKKGKYSSTPVQTSYGYHVIYKTEILDREEVSDIRDRIVSKVVEAVKESDSNYYQKTLLKMREDANLEIKDTSLSKSYDIFKKSLFKVDQNN